ncbi:MAG: hypothetical protein Q7R54_00050 [bacterium]|nr:hypothetical protein [bacterium]
MSNLLSQEDKKNILRGYRFRLAIVTLCFSLVTALIATALLLPSVLLSSQREHSALERVAVLSKGSGKPNVRELTAPLNDAKLRLPLLSHTAPDVSLRELLNKVVEARSDRISLIRFSFVGSGEEKREVDISGTSRDRAALLAFVKALERTGLFESVEIPISNYAKDTDIDFSLRAIRAS